MLSKCCNPGCFRTFHYLHEGRLFTIGLGRDRAVSSDNADYLGRKQPTRVEHFWLCDECSKQHALEIAGDMSRKIGSTGGRFSFQGNLPPK